MAVDHKALEPAIITLYNEAEPIGRGYDARFSDRFAATYTDAHLEAEILRAQSALEEGCARICFDLGEQLRFALPNGQIVPERGSQLRAEMPTSEYLDGLTREMARRVYYV